MPTLTVSVVSTARERQILRAITANVDARGYAPSVRELCETLQVQSTNGMIQHLRNMAAKGLLDREIATARALRVTALGIREVALEDAGAIPAEREE
jgi:repressor LexA